jgi:hypothetical protein
VLPRCKFDRRRLLLGLLALSIASGATSAHAATDHVTRIVERAGAPVPIPLGEYGPAYASCHSDEQLVGGGARVTTFPDFGNHPFLQASAPDPAHPNRRWLARGYGFNDISDVNAYAFCAKSGGRDHVKTIVRRAGASVAIPPAGPYATSQGTAFASCHSDEQLVGGGALGGLSADHGGILLQVSAPDPNNALRWKAHGETTNTTPGGAQSLRATAFCARSAAAGDHVKTIDRRSDLTPPPPTPNAARRTDASASCDSGEQLVGGGALGAGDGNLLAVSAPDPVNLDRRWRARASQGFGDLVAYAYCAD